ncbi:multidrug effflux MFS transporter [Aquibium sp. A9E412]|uniref:multidrug effflux MFS transporter n=1 Tax=Aquibium sp. A9E412 TaxID=2976767 RepID=UPI0025AF28A9|nr:multidrug effflux MFS transporter [Aquibium sp. A9E412]MDN2568580.1 multidrug effflux MFS transporter [Aquibium sp. A9E412]
MAVEHAAAPVTTRRSATRGPEFIAILAGLMALNALAIDIMLPAFPEIAADLALSDANHAQFVILSYVVGFGGAQLFFGPVSDRFGRRAPLFAGLALYILSAAAGALAPSFELLIAARVLQGIGAAATRTIALSVVRDTHSGRDMAAIMSLVMVVFMVVPVFAPLAGQVIVLFGEWHLVFLSMAVFGGAMLLWTALRLPETLPEARRRPLTMASVIGAFRIVVSNRTSLFYALATAFFFSSLYAFLNSAQQIYVDIYGLGPLFPVAFASVAMLMAVSSFLNSRLVRRVGQRRLSHTALLLYAVLSTALAVIAWLMPVPFWLFLGMFCLIMPLFGWVGANLNSIAMEPLGAVAGTGASVLGFTQTVGGGIVGALIGQAFDGTIFPLVTGFAGVSVIALGLILIAEKGRLFGVGPA